MEFSAKQLISSFAMTVKSMVLGWGVCHPTGGVGKLLPIFHSLCSWGRISWRKLVKNSFVQSGQNLSFFSANSTHENVTFSAGNKDETKARKVKTSTLLHDWTTKVKDWIKKIAPFKYVVWFQIILWSWRYSIVGTLEEVVIVAQEGFLGIFFDTDKRSRLLQMS